MHEHAGVRSRADARADVIGFPEGTSRHPNPEAEGMARSGPRRWTAILRGVVMVVLTVLVIVAAVAVSRWLVATKPPVPQQVVAERPKPIDTLVARVGTIRPQISAYGNVVAGRTVDLRMLVAGEVVEVSPAFVEGGRVTAGETLVAVDRFTHEGTLVRARAELTEAEARIQEIAAKIQQERDGATRAEEQRVIAVRELERVADLARRGNASTSDADASRTRLLTATAAVENRTNQLDVLAAQRAREIASLDRLRWAVSSAERDLRNTRLVAPFDGVVSNVGAEVGRLLNVNDRAATLVDLGRLEVRFSLTDAQYGRFLAAGETLEGRPVTLVWRGGGASVERAAAVDRIAPVIAAATGGVDVYARIVPADGQTAEPLRPGAFIEVAMDDAPRAGVVRVPQSAVHPGDVVYEVGPDSRLIPIAVTMAGFDGDAALVRGEIRDGATLMATRLSEAGPGVLVTPRSAP